MKMKPIIEKLLKRKPAAVTYTCHGCDAGGVEKPYQVGGYTDTGARAFLALCDDCIARLEQPKTDETPAA